MAEFDPATDSVHLYVPKERRRARRAARATLEGKARTAPPTRSSVSTRALGKRVGHGRCVVPARGAPTRAKQVREHRRRAAAARRRDAARAGGRGAVDVPVEVCDMGRRPAGDSSQFAEHATRSRALPSDCRMQPRLERAPSSCARGRRGRGAAGSGAERARARECCRRATRTPRAWSLPTCNRAPMMTLTPLTRRAAPVSARPSRARARTRPSREQDPSAPARPHARSPPRQGLREGRARPPHAFARPRGSKKEGGDQTCRFDQL